MTTVRDLSVELGVPLQWIIRTLMAAGQMRTATMELSAEEIELVRSLRHEAPNVTRTPAASRDRPPPSGRRGGGGRPPDRRRPPGGSTPSGTREPRVPPPAGGSAEAAEKPPE